MTPTLTAAERELVAGSRRATLATIAPDGRPRLVPICFVLIDDVVWSALDEKPKAVRDVRRLARVRDIEREPRVTLLVDRWAEDWAELVWVRIDGRATLVNGEPSVTAELRGKYAQYADHDLEGRPLIAITIERMTSWKASPSETDASRRSVE